MLLMLMLHAEYAAYAEAAYAAAYAAYADDDYAAAYAVDAADDAMLLMLMLPIMLIRKNY